MKVAHIGATGNVGSRILAELLRRGHEVTGIVRHPETLSPHDRLTARQGDVNDEDSLAALLSDHDAVICTTRLETSSPHSLIGAVKKADVTWGLRAFREAFYACLLRRGDALFELTDAILTAGTTPSPPHLSLAPIHRRGWGSLYVALSKGGVDDEMLRELLASYDSGTNRTPVYAVDISPWPRCDAERGHR